MKEYINKYAYLGLRIFPCLSSKIPATSHGFYDASSDPAVIERLFHDDNFRIGLPTGKVNKIVVIDFDVKDGRTVDELKDEIINNFGPLPDTFQVQTPSLGLHMYYSAPDTNLSSSSRTFDKSLGVDIRANNGYVLAPGSPGYEIFDDVDDIGLDALANLTPLPDWIESFKKSVSVPVDTGELLPESEVREIRSALNFIDADLRDNWVSVGIALRETGTVQARGLWDEWSQRSEKYNPKDQESKWKSFKPRGDLTIASIFHMAKSQGWTTTYDKGELIKADAPEIPQNVLDSVNTVQTVKNCAPAKKPFPDELLHPGGLVGDIMQYILDTAIRPQPVFALAGALCAVATLAGRKYQTTTGLRTNIYCLSVGTSGCGKESPRQAIKKLFSMADCDKYLGVEAIASDASIISELQENLSRMFMLDEIGRFLKTTTSATKSTYLYNVVSTLLSIHGAADSLYYGKSYSDLTKKIKLDQPNLCIYGTTVPDSLYNGMTIENITDGFLARFNVFETDNPRPQKKRISNIIRSQTKPIEIIDQIKYLDKRNVNVEPNGNLDKFNADPMIVPFSDAALEIVNNFDNYIEQHRQELDNHDNKLESLYNRTSATAMQIALIIAIGENIDNPIITEDNMNYGAALALHLADHMAYIAENFIAQNELEHEVKKIYRLIKLKGKMSMSEITRKTQHIQGHLRADVLETLERSDQVVKSDLPGAGKKKITWFFDRDLIEGG